MPVFKHWFSLTKGSQSVISFRTECVCAMDEWVNEINSILHVYCTLKNQMSASCRGHQPAHSICSSRENLTNNPIIAWSDFFDTTKDTMHIFVFYFFVSFFFRRLQLPGVIPHPRKTHMLCWYGCQCNNPNSHTVICLMVNPAGLVV